MVQEPTMPADHAPYHVRLDPDTARSMASQGATVLMLGVPPGAVVGVDHQAFAVGELFRGIKMLPPGMHFLSAAAAVPGSAAVAPSTGFFLQLAPSQVVVKMWDAVSETLVDMHDRDEAERYAHGVRNFDFDAHLAPYDLSSYAKWRALSGHITPELASQLSPIGDGAISVIAEAADMDTQLADPKTPAEARLAQQLRAGHAALQERLQRMGVELEQPQSDAAAPGTARTPSAPNGDAPIGTGREAVSSGSDGHAGSRGRCFYTRLPRLVKSRGLSAAELTAANMDKSSLLLGVARERYGGRLDALLGELQFAFVAFVYGQSLDGFAQWKALLMALLGCEDAVLHTHQSVFVELMRALSVQLHMSLGPDPSSAPGDGFGGHGSSSSNAGGGAGNVSAGSTGQQEAPLGVPMVEELLPDSFLRKMFGRFFSLLQESSSEVSAELDREASAVKQVLRAHLGWEYDFHIVTNDDDDDAEDMPVVVDLTEPYPL